MKQFDKEKQMFLLTGTFNNQFDNVGNLNLSIYPVVIEDEYIAFNLRSNEYNNEQIESLYDVNIKEFNNPTNQENIISPINIESLQQENDNLKSQLNLIVQNSNSNSLNSDVSGAKNTIIKLRIQLGEGNTEEDFSDVFPYLKI